MHAKFYTRALAALAIGLYSVSPAAATDTCLCTQRVDWQTFDGPHNWFVTADASAALKVTLALEITTTDTGEVNADHLNASIYSPGGALLDTIEIASSVPGWFRGDFTVTSTAPGDVYRVEIHRSAPHATVHHASRYFLRFDGADDAAIASPLRSLNGGRTTWTVYADAGDTMGVRIFDPLTFPNPPADYPVMYQWIAPDGTAQPVGAYTVPGPGMDTMIPPPSGLVPGKWRLRLQTLSFAGVGWGYAIEKTTGTDQHLHVEPGLAGRGLGGRISFVDQNGDPYTGEVLFTFGFGEQFSFLLGVEEPGDPDVPTVFETDNPTDVFPIPISITPPAGFVATPSQFAFLPPCDGFFEQIVVIAQPPSLSLALTPAKLWPANNKLVDVAASVTATSPYGNDVSVTLESISSSDASLGDDIVGAILGTDDRAFQLRATRSGGNSSRLYTVKYRTTDLGTGLSTTATATVIVPHDQRK